MAAPMSPDEWRDELLKRLAAQARSAAYFQAYYDGQHADFGLTTTKYRQAFGEMLNRVRDNWMPIVVDAVAERLKVEGFRIGDDPAGDADAWRIWQESNLDADSELGQTTALTCGLAFVMVAPGRDRAEITVEHPGQVYVAAGSGNRRERVAAIKSWTDEWTGADRATLYLPEGVWRWVAEERGSWRLLSTERNPFGVVPIIPLRNRPDLFGGCRSELHNVTETQDQINKLVCDMIVASEYQSFRQRWATGVEIPVDPDTGKPVQPWDAAIDRVWAVPDQDARFGEFGQVDLGGYVKALENRIQSLASRSRTPAHYMLGQSGSFPSGESLKATETGLIAKVRSRQVHFGEVWEEVIRLAFKAQDDPRADAVSAETIWSDPESRTESEHVDALVKKLAIGVPLQQLWEDAGYSQTQIARFRQMALEEAFTRAVAGGQVAAPPPVESPMTAPDASVA